MSGTDDLTCKEVAAALKIPAQQVRYLIHSGAIAAYDISRSPGRPTWRIRRSALAAFKRGRTRRAA